VTIITIALIVSKSLFIKVTEEMERFDAHVGSLDATL